MKRLSFTILILSMVFSMACGKSAKEDSASKSGTVQSAIASPESAKASPIPATNPDAAPEAATASGMNPPHGEPNHRCDIAVGAPLNSPPETRPTQPTTSQPTVSVQPTAPTTVAAGMNPPHGQPNHRCDIAVGAPLNSPPGRK